MKSKIRDIKKHWVPSKNLLLFVFLYFSCQSPGEISGPKDAPTGIIAVESRIIGAETFGESFSKVEAIIYQNSAILDTIELDNSTEHTWKGNIEVLSRELKENILYSVKSNAYVDSAIYFTDSSRGFSINTLDRRPQPLNLVLNIDTTASKILIDTANIKANGVSTTLVQVIPKFPDGRGIKKGNLDIEFITTKGTFILDPEKSDSLYSQRLRSTSIATSAIIKVKVNGIDIDTLVTVNFGLIADPVLSVPLASKFNVRANGTDSTVITVTPRDANGQLLGPGSEVKITRTLFDELEREVVAREKGNTYSRSFTSYKAGEDIIKVKVNEIDLLTELHINYFSVIDVANLRLSSDFVQAPADGKSEIIASITLKDFQGRKLGSGQDVQFTVENADKSQGVFFSPMDSSYNQKITSRMSGKTDISVHVNNELVPHILSVDFVQAVSPNNTSLTIDVNPSRVLADGALTTVSVVPKDFEGNVMEGLQNVLIDSDFGQKQGGVLRINDSTYTQSFSSFFTGTGAIAVSINGIDIPSTRRTSFSPAIDTSTTIVQVSDEILEADGFSTTVVTIVPIDFAGNRMGVGLEVQFLDPPGTQFVGPISEDVVLGAYSKELRSATTPGHVDIEILVEGISMRNNALVYFRGPVDPSTTLFTSDQTSVSADGVSPVILTVIPRDVNGVELGKNQLLTWARTLGQFLGPEVYDDNNKSYSRQLVSDSTGASEVSVKVNGVPIVETILIDFTSELSKRSSKWRQK